MEDYEIQEQIELESVLLNEAYSKVFSTDEGIRVLEDILFLTGYFSSSFTGNSKTYYNEGRRDVAVDMIDKIDEAVPDAVIQVMQRRMKRLQENKEVK